MSHQIKPSIYRIGKIIPWYSNSISDFKIDKNEPTKTLGVGKLVKHFLKKKRFFFLKSSRSGRLKYCVLFMPRIKTRPKDYIHIGLFGQRSLFRNVSLGLNALGQSRAEGFIHRRKRDDIKIKGAVNPHNLNKWLSQRMFRGSYGLGWDKRSVVINKLPYNTKSSLNDFPQGLLHVNITNNGGFGKKICVTASRRFLKARRNIHLSRRKMYYNFIHRKVKWKMDTRKWRLLRGRRVSNKAGNILQSRVRINFLNVFTYLVEKRLLSRWSAQDHFWIRAYKNLQYRYANYFDILNCFFVLSTFVGTESILLSLVQSILPRLRGIRRFMYFLDKVIKNLPQIRAQFSCFRMLINGKLAGGTKRTKSMKIGYGWYAFNSINVNAVSNFVQFTHKFG